MLKLLPPPPTHVPQLTTTHELPHSWQAKTYHFDRGEQLPAYGDRIWQITTGYLRSVTWTQEGEITTLGIWGQSDFVGHALSIVAPYYLECLTPVTATLCAYPTTPQLPEILLHNAQQTEQLLAISHERQVRDRLLRLFNWLAARFGEVTPTGKLLQIGMTHQQIAELAGTTRVTATRLINQLEADQYIQRLTKRRLLVQPLV
jgi:CRP-like cAMP-binding protein